MHLHAYVIMSNHVHLIVSVDEGFTVSGFVRDCKKFTSKKILDAMKTVASKVGGSGCCTSLNIMLPGIGVTKRINCGSTITTRLN